MRKIKIIIAITIFILSNFILGLALPALVQAQQLPTVDQAPHVMEELNAFGEQTPIKHDTDIPRFVGRIIKWVIGLIGVILMVLIIYGGFLYATSAGNEKQTETAKKTLIYAIIGVIIVGLAYFLTDFVISVLFPRPIPK